MRCVVIRPAYDGPTITSHAWAQPLLQALISSGIHEVVDLPKRFATRNQVESAVVFESADFVAFFGHGLDACLLEQDGTSHSASCAIDLSNIWVLNGAVVLAIACNSARTLGPAAIGVGAVAYVGFEVVVEWTSRHAARFGLVIAELFLSILDGRTVDEAVAAAVSAAEAQLQHFYSLVLDATDPRALRAAELLEAMVEGLTIHGNGTAQLT